MKTKDRDIPYCGVRQKVIEKAHPMLDEEVMAHLRNFIIERYNIYVKKEIMKMPAPWTKNPILAKYRFTNVFRELDYVTKSLINGVSKVESLPFEDRFLNTILFRLWNNPDTFFDLGGPWTKEEIYNGLELKEKVRPVYRELAQKDPNRLWWSAAYNQGATKSVWKYPTGDGLKRTGEKDLEPDIPLRVFHLGPYLKEHNIFKRCIRAKDQKACYEVLLTIPAFASFIAYQVFVDLTYMWRFPFSENEFVVAGPGCKKGLDMLFLDRDGMTYEECLFYLRNGLDEFFQALEYGDYAIGYDWRPDKLFRFRDPQDQCLTVMSLENCFCELSKYVRTYEGLGRPRNTYKPRKEKSNE